MAAPAALPSLTDAQREQLAAPLDASRVKSRQGRGGGPALSYLETHDVIRTANSIFGHGAWGHEVVELRPLGQTDVKSSQGKEGIAVGYLCTVRLTVAGCVPVSGIGFGDATEYTQTAAISAHELAAKEAESDALKRALKNYGDQFGLALYDKQAARNGHVVAENGNGGPKASKEQVEEIETLIALLHESDTLPEPTVRDVMKKQYATEISAELSKQQATDLVKRLAAKAPKVAA